MLRIGRAAAGLVLALAFVAAPLEADWCAVACEAAHAGAPAAGAECHHADSVAVRVSHPPKPCGHNHNGLVVVAAANLPAASPIPIVTSATASAVHVTIARHVSMMTRADPEIDRPPLSIPLALSSNLRI